MPPGSVNVASDVFVAREVNNAKLHNFLGGLYLQEQYGLILLPPTGRKLTIGKCSVANFHSLCIVCLYVPTFLCSKLEFGKGWVNFWIAAKCIYANGKSW